MSLDSHYTDDLLEAGVDEVARGCLAGPVFAAAVIWPRDLDPLQDHPILRDSKKLSRNQRNYMREYIECTAIDFSVASVNNQEIDAINIRNAAFLAMHRAVDGLNVTPEFLLVDGNAFKPYIISKGSIAIDGISLTVVDPLSNQLSCHLIPHTIKQTNLHTKLNGDSVNLEFDQVGKYLYSFYSNEKS